MMFYTVHYWLDKAEAKKDRFPLIADLPVGNPILGHNMLGLFCPILGHFSHILGHFGGNK